LRLATEDAAARPRHNLKTRERQELLSANTAKLSRKTLCRQKQCLDRAPVRGRRPCAVLFAPWRGLRERSWSGAPFSFPPAGQVIVGDCFRSSVISIGGRSTSWPCARLLTLPPVDLESLGQDLQAWVASICRQSSHSPQLLPSSDPLRLARSRVGREPCAVAVGQHGRPQGRADQPRFLSSRSAELSSRRGTFPGPACVVTATVDS